MVALSTSETQVNLYQTARRDNPEDSHVHTRRRENLKSHIPGICLFCALNFTDGDGTFITAHKVCSYLLLLPIHLRQKSNLELTS
jgi:hypothetical protein